MLRERGPLSSLACRVNRGGFDEGFRVVPEMRRVNAATSCHKEACGGLSRLLEMESPLWMVNTYKAALKVICALPGCVAQCEG